MISLRFKVGDNVIARVPKPDLPQGARGSIVHAAGSKQYIVQFGATLILMRGYELSSEEQQAAANQISGVPTPHRSPNTL
jgi:hypothetical protein